MSNIMRSLKKMDAIEIYALNPNVTAEEVAIQTGVQTNTVYKWRKDPNFIDAIYKRYMQEFGGELPAVLNAMVREAKSGNVQAGRLVLEHSGKLVKNINVTVDSPFEKWLSKVENAEVVDGEVVEDEIDELMDTMPIIETKLPPRKEENQEIRTKTEKKKVRAIDKSARKKAKYLKQRKEWYKWNKRAEAVGMKPLKGGRPTKGQRKEWEDEIIRRESEKKDS